jgi:hypothetical protein
VQDVLGHDSVVCAPIHVPDDAWDIVGLCGAASGVHKDLGSTIRRGEGGRY